MIVPFAPGGPNDFLGRLVAQKITEQIGQTVVVENRGGAGGTVGLGCSQGGRGRLHARDGGHQQHGRRAQPVYRKPLYDSLKDFTPVIGVAHVPYALAVNPTVPAWTLEEVIALAARKPGNLSCGSSGTGSVSSLAAELLKPMASSRRG